MKFNDKLIMQKGKNRATIIKNHSLFSFEGDEFKVFNQLENFSTVEELIAYFYNNDFKNIGYDLVESEIKKFINELIKKGILIASPNS